MMTQNPQGDRQVANIDPQIKAACDQLGWTIVGQTFLYGKQAAVLVQANGIIEPYTNERILREAALQRSEDDLDAFIRQRQATHIREHALQPA
jgi:hypothetical protein